MQYKASSIWFPSDGRCPESEDLMQATKLYVGNLVFSVTGKDLEELFSQHGTVKEAKVIQGKGFAFVEMSTQLEAERAKAALDNFEFKGLNLKIQQAKPPKKQSSKRGFRR
jgi:RNA recognition motif-containing protein